MDFHRLILNLLVTTGVLMRFAACIKKAPSRLREGFFIFKGADEGLLTYDKSIHFDVQAIDQTT